MLHIHSPLSSAKKCWGRDKGAFSYLLSEDKLAHSFAALTFHCFAAFVLPIYLAVVIFYILSSSLLIKLPISSSEFSHASLYLPYSQFPLEYSITAMKHKFLN